MAATHKKAVAKSIRRQARKKARSKMKFRRTIIRGTDKFMARVRAKRK